MGVFPPPQKQKAMENKMTLEQFAEVINKADEWKLEFDDIIFANDWTPIFDEWHICHDGKNMIYFDDKGIAKVKSIEELETEQIDRDLKLFLILEELESFVRERKLTAREAEIELNKKYDIEELEDVLPHRKVIVMNFDNKNLYLENGECVSGEFPRKGKIHDNVEYCTDTQRFEFIEYFVKEDEDE